MVTWEPNDTLDDTEVALPWWEGGECEWPMDTEDTPQLNLTQTIGNCGIRASQAGELQKVISYTLYGTSDIYWQKLELLLESITVFYPGWLVRLHTTPTMYQPLLCQHIKNQKHFYICDITNLPAGLDLSNSNPLMWRMAPLGDPQVEVFIARDLDTMVNSDTA